MRSSAPSIRAGSPSGRSRGVAWIHFSCMTLKATVTPSHAASAAPAADHANAFANLRMAPR